MGCMKVALARALSWITAGAKHLNRGANQASPHSLWMLRPVNIITAGYPAAGSVVNPNSDDDIHQPAGHNNHLAHRLTIQRGLHSFTCQGFFLRFAKGAAGDCAVGWHLVFKI